MGDKADTFLVLCIVGVLLFALFFWPNMNNNSDYWFVSVSVSPLNAGSVSPSGNVSVSEGESQIFVTSANDDYSFQNWVFNGLNFGSQPQLSLPSQDVNSSNVLVAVFSEKNPVFSISPSKSFTRGLSSVFSLTLNNLCSSHFSDVKLRLVDPYGVFSSFSVSNGWHSRGYSGGGVWWVYTTNCLNVWSDKVVFNTFSAMDGTGIVEPFSSSSFVCGNNYDYYERAISVVVSSSVESGTYILSWEIQFSVDSGDYSGSPLLSIPWAVTVYG